MEWMLGGAEVGRQAIDGRVAGRMKEVSAGACIDGLWMAIIYAAGSG